MPASTLVVPPRFRSVPAAVDTAGGEVVDLAATAKLHLDPWQRDVVHDALGERDAVERRWSAVEVGLVVPRQNGKGSILEAVELAALVLFGADRVVHSAHRWDTSMDAFARFLTLLEENPDLSKRVKRVIKAHSEEGVEFKSGQRIRFQTRTASGGRGLWGDLVILDEAFDLAASSMASLMPTLSARRNPQVWYTSSAGMPSSTVLRRVRERGIAGEQRLCYIEYSVDPQLLRDGGDPDDPEVIKLGNPSYTIRLNPEIIAVERAQLTEADYFRERLGIWDDPSTDAVIDPEKWADLADENSKPLDPVTFAVDVNPDRTHASIAIAALNAEGFVHNELVAVRSAKRGIGWLVEKLVELDEKWNPDGFVLDGAGPAGSLVPDLKTAGIDPVVLNPKDMAAACGLFYDRVDQGLIRHTGMQPRLAVALGAARKRPLGDAWAWARKDTTVDISPLVAVTLAGYGLVTAPSRKRPRSGRAWGSNDQTTERTPVRSTRSGRAWGSW